MALRGTKPKSKVLKFATGNPGHRPVNENEPEPEGKPKKPKFLKGKAAKLWDEYVEIGYWLTSGDSHTLAAWCGLAAEMERDLKNMTSSRISQWRVLSAELGFTPSSRSRISTGIEKPKPKTSTDKFYASS